MALAVFPSELLDDILARRRVLETAEDSPRYRETWRRLRFVVDQARAWSEAEHGSLREYLTWAAGQAEDRARVTETVLPETDTDAVRITTIHAAKGLQFPFVVVAGLGSAGSTQRPPVLWPPEGGCELKLGRGLETLGYADADAVEQQIEDCKDRRLLYVAATRAQRHLAVSLHRKGQACPAETLAQACADAEHECWAAPEVIEPLAAAPRPPADPLPSWQQWTANRDAALANGARREAESATDIAHGDAAVELPTFARDGLVLVDYKTDAATPRTRWPPTRHSWPSTPAPSPTPPVSRWSGRCCRSFVRVPRSNTSPRPAAERLVLSPRRSNVPVGPEIQCQARQLA